MSRAEMIELFSVDGINAAPSVFDLEKLNWMNGVYIRALTPEQLVEQALPFLQNAGLVEASPSPERLAYVTEVLKLEQERLRTLAEAPEATDFFFRDLPEYDESAVSKRLNTPSAGPVLDAVTGRLEAASDWTIEQVEGAVRGAIEALGVKAGEVIHPTRVAATGRTVGPGLFETLWALGKDRVLQRLRHARQTFVPAA
jgi:glutamyl-tRNA synthetase